MIPDLKLNNGHKIPQIGLGTWQMMFGRTCRKAVKTALDQGYRHFDTAQVYFNEQHVGRAIRDSGIPRSEIFLTTKIWRGRISDKGVLPSFKKSLKKLQTDYVDLLLLHFPVSPDKRRAGWQKLEELHNAGQARSIGVSNYTITHLEELLEHCTVKPAVNQVELHVFLQQPELLSFCRKHDIAIEAYSPLAHGHGLDNATLQAIAQKYQRTTAQIMLRWLVEQGLIILPKSSHPERIQQNFQVFDFKLDKDDMKQIKRLERNLRTCWDPTNVE